MKTTDEKKTIKMRTKTKSMTGQRQLSQKMIKTTDKDKEGKVDRRMRTGTNETKMEK